MGTLYPANARLGISTHAPQCSFDDGADVGLVSLGVMAGGGVGFGEGEGDGIASFSGGVT
jgi:hypothetical protein